MSHLPSHPNDTFRKLNQHIYGSMAHVVMAPAIMAKNQPAPKRIRQSSKPKLNKLEQAYFDHLSAKYPNNRLRAQSVTYVLANGLRYTPDITSPGIRTDTDDESKPTNWEIKGPYAFGGSLEKLKMAAAVYPEIRWLLIWKDDDGWHEQEVIP